MLKKVSTNPVSVDKGVYGKPLGNHSCSNLAGYYKIKMRSSGIRVVYELKEIKGVMYIIIVGLRYNVYEEAVKRLK